MERLIDSTQPICEQCEASGMGCNLYECGEAFTQEHCSQYRIFKKLAEFEDAEEQGLLVRLPCRVGDTVFIIDQVAGINPRHVTGINCNNWNNEWYVQVGLFGTYHTSDFGKHIFLSQAEAEAKLKGGAE